MRRRILIFAKTYPQPSKKYEETVCTGGLFEDGSFARLYPIAYRRLPKDKQFRRYQWIEANIVKSKDDPRKESYRIEQETIDVISKPLSTANCWAARKVHVLKRLSRSIEDLRNQQDRDGTSLGIIKPKRIVGFFSRPKDPMLDQKRTLLARQSDLFRAELRPLDKLPCEFGFEFFCDNSSCGGHKLTIWDWEIYALYSNCRRSAGDESQAIQCVRHKIEHDVWTERKDLYFYMGTTKFHPKSWTIVGLFYPPAPPSDDLFGS